MNRRTFMAGLVAAGVLPYAFTRALADNDAIADNIILTNAEKGRAKGANIVKVVKSDAEWRSILTPEQYYILREEGTERSFTSPLNNEKRDGTYFCAGCDLELFTSEMKFDSGTGWPSFYTVIEGHVGTKSDYKLLLPRTEYHCARCDGHQGHLFKDGPAPTRLRYCNNGLALKFQAS